MSDPEEKMTRRAKERGKKVGRPRHVVSGRSVVTLQRIATERGEAARKKAAPKVDRQ
jgi:hypothetical protein